jgi:hypothetical protein
MERCALCPEETNQTTESPLQGMEEAAIGSRPLIHLLCGHSFHTYCFLSYLLLNLHLEHEICCRTCEQNIFPLELQDLYAARRSTEVDKTVSEIYESSEEYGKLLNELSITLKQFKPYKSAYQKKKDELLKKFKERIISAKEFIKLAQKEAKKELMKSEYRRKYAHYVKKINTLFSQTMGIQHFYKSPRRLQNESKEIPNGPRLRGLDSVPSIKSLKEETTFLLRHI